MLPNRPGRQVSPTATLGALAQMTAIQLAALAATALRADSWIFSSKWIQ